MKKNGFFKGILSVLLSLLFVSCGDMLTLSDTASLTLAFPWGNERSVSADDITQINVTLYSLDRDILIGEKNLTASSPNASFTNLKAENVRVLVKAFKTEENGYITELGSCQEDVKLKTGFNTLQLYLNPQKIASGKGSLSNPCLNIGDFLTVLSTEANKERTTLVYVNNTAFAKDTSGNSGTYTTGNSITPFNIPAGTNAEVHFVKGTSNDDDTTTYAECVFDNSEGNGEFIEVAAQINVKSGAKLTFFGYQSNSSSSKASYLKPGTPISGGTTKDCLIKVENGGCLKMQGMNFTEIQVDNGGDLTIGNAMCGGSWTTTYGSTTTTYYVKNYITLKGSASLTLGDVDTATIHLSNSSNTDKPKITLTSSLRENTMNYSQYNSCGYEGNSHVKVYAANSGIMLRTANPSLLTESLFSSLSIQGVDYNKYITYYAPGATEDYSFAEDGTLRKCISNIFDLPENASGKYYVKTSETTNNGSNDTSSSTSETSTPLVISNDVTILPKVVTTTTTTTDGESSTSVKTVKLNFNYTGASSSDGQSTDSSPSDDSALITVKNGASLKFENFTNDDSYGVQADSYTFAATISNPNAKSLFLIEEGASVELPPTFSLSSSDTGLTQLFYNKGSLTVNKDSNITDTTNEENVTVPYIITATKNAKTYFAGENTYVKSLYLKDGATLTLASGFSIPSGESQTAIELYLDDTNYTVGTKVITLEDSNSTVTTSNFSIEGAPSGTSVELKDTGFLEQSEA